MSFNDDQKNTTDVNDDSVEETENEQEASPSQDLDQDSFGMDALLSEKAKLEEELKDSKDRLLRTLAEMDNLHKRSIKEREDAQKYAISGFVQDLLSITDTMDRALDSIPEDKRQEPGLFQTLYQGIVLTKDEMTKTFERNHVHAIHPLNEKFDPNFHQAVLDVENSGLDTGYVVKVLQTGYTLNGRLLRPAMVSVAK